MKELSGGISKTKGTFEIFIEPVYCHLGKTFWGAFGFLLSAVVFRIVEKKSVEERTLLNFFKKKFLPLFLLF